MILDRGPGHVFPGRIDGHLSAAYVGKRISKLLPPNWTAHTLRHRFASAELWLKVRALNKTGLVA